MNAVSECCHKPIVVGRRMEYPLGGSKWGQAFKSDNCEGCGIECDPVEACGICGVVGCGEDCG